MEYLADLETIVRVNSFTSNKEGVNTVGLIFHSWMAELGYKRIRHSRSHIGDHLHFRTARGDGRKILLLGHMDTVFPPGSFETYRDDGEWVYGPGVCDMKGGLIVILEALREVHRRHGRIENIDLLLVSDEETGSEDAKAVTMEVAKDYDCCFVFEAAGPNQALVVGRKGVGTFTMDIEGRATHAGNQYSNGINANLEAAIKLVELTKLTDLSKGTTVNVGRIEGGIGANTISPHASLLFEIRYRETAERDRLLVQIGRLVEQSQVAGTKTVLGGGLQRDVMEPGPRQQNLLQAIETITGMRLPTESRGGVSDANVTSTAGLVTLDGFGPYGEGDHSDKEKALKASFEQRIELVSKILLQHQANKQFF